MTDMLIGIDTSLWDPIVDWKQYDWDFAFIKVIEGMVEDPRFRQQWEAARGYTIRGPYDFFHHFNNQKEVVAKLSNLLGNDRGELPPVLDLEDHDGEPRKVAPKALEWCREAENRFGRKPIVYTSLGFATSDGVDLAQERGLAEYPLWLAVYPWDKITQSWTEQKRTLQIQRIIHNRELFVVPNAIAPWNRLGKPSVIQWTSKCPPEFVPGYPLDGKKAVDINFYPGTMQRFFEEYNISYTPKPRGDDMDKPITMTALLRELQPSNLRNLPGTVGTNVLRTLVGPLTIKGTGQKMLKDGFWWIEVVAINSDPVTGWVALTTSYTNIVWIETPSPSTRNISRVVTHFDDGSSVETFPR
jgi:hypothetical protein